MQSLQLSRSIVGIYQPPEAGRELLERVTTAAFDLASSAIPPSPHAPRMTLGTCRSRTVPAGDGEHPGIDRVSDCSASPPSATGPKRRVVDLTEHRTTDRSAPPPTSGGGAAPPDRRDVAPAAPPHANPMCRRRSPDMLVPRRVGGAVKRDQGPLPRSRPHPEYVSSEPPSASSSGTAPTPSTVPASRDHHRPKRAPNLGPGRMAVLKQAVPDYRGAIFADLCFLSVTRHGI